MTIFENSGLFRINLVFNYKYFFIISLNIRFFGIKKPLQINARVLN